MNLYRLDYHRVSAPDDLSDPVRAIDGGPVLYVRRADADRDAKAIAAEGYYVRITRIGRAGHLTPMAIASPETHRIHRIRS
jgi:hypothetical protein